MVREWGKFRSMIVFPRGTADQIDDYERIHHRCPLCTVMCDSWADRVRHLILIHNWR